MKQGNLLPGLVAVAALLLTLGPAGAEASADRAILSHEWRGITLIGGLKRCRLLGSAPRSWNALRDVDLTDHITSTYTPYKEPEWELRSAATLGGTVTAAGGTYTVAGGPFAEHRTGTRVPWYFDGSGPATISGPGGSAAGEATFKDLTQFPPALLELRFTTLTACHLESRASPVGHSPRSPHPPGRLSRNEP